MIERMVPYDIPAERVVLGSLLMEREAIIAVNDKLHPDDFYLEKHGLIYEAIVACFSQRIPPDISTVSSELRRRERIDLVGGVSFLTELIVEVPTAVHVEYYAQTVIMAAIRRRLIAAGGAIAALGFNQQTPLEEALDAAEQQIYAISQQQRGSDFLPISLVAQQYFDAAEGDTDAGLVPTGLIDLDQRLGGGLRAHQLVLIAARPSMGKSGLAMSIAHHLGIKRRRNVAIVSLEMGRHEIMERLIAIHTGINTQEIAQRMKRGDPLIVNALAKIASGAIKIEDNTGISVMDVCSKARRLATREPLDLLIIDYLQLLDSGTDRSQNRNEEVAQISRKLKRLAGELHCPVIALSQLSRAVESRQMKVPQLSDLRDSGSLEQDADIVLFIYRDDAYMPANQPRTNTAEIHVAKQRNGPVGVTTVRFNAPTTHFTNLTNRSQAE
ncbi:MAG: replicative DNA helicase [Candidatus Viridilinea halotolerans]|uniref:Replicative DNA helicase n=1 Tax=Candidatus Viridilinea halotolerans TaxID=2491704 RepID=A0A426U5X3_9CHLR|nr:MAG: replicative DNA helicase [Candidatus Viridilinea halotolerans]